MTREVILGSPAARLSISSPQLVTSSPSLTECIPAWDATDFAVNNAAAATSGITVPIQGYYLVQACLTFSSSSSSSYTGPVAGALGYVSIFNTTTGAELTRGSTLAQPLASSPYTSVAADLIYIGQYEQVTATAFGSTPSSSLYIWSDSDSISSYFSLTYVCV